MSSTPSIGARGRPRSADADRAILDAVHALILDVGYEGMTMAAVAQRAGVSTATLYRRFTDKADLVSGLVDQLRPTPRTIDTGSLEGDLWAALDDAEELARSPVGPLLLALAGLKTKHPELRKRLEEVFECGPVGELRTILHRAVERGEIPPLGNEETAVIHLVGPVLWRLLVDQEPPDEQQVAWSMAMVIAALRVGFPEPARRPSR
ncbi:MAG: TetR/AcrR family transcriptional regulator [Ilumatobacteraceae bacterium]